MRKVILISISVALAFIGCSKQKDEPKKEQEVSHSVTYNIYSKHTPYLFGHSEGKTGSIDTIRTNNYSAILQVQGDAMSFYQYVQSVKAYSSDSLHIRAEYEGKKVENSFGYHSGGGSIISISIQLSQAK